MSSNDQDFAETKQIEHSLNGTEAFNEASLKLAFINDESLEQPGFYENEELFRTY